jgi:hypothetical protein
MSKVQELLHEGRRQELWQLCCGYLDLHLDQFMVIQKRLLLEQIELLKKCELGRKVMRGAMPETVEEFREQVPLTTYIDYCPELLEQREDVLPAKTGRWVRTSGRSGEYSAKWVPWSENFCDELSIIGGTLAVLSLARRHGDVSRVKEHLKLLMTMGPPEYGSRAVGDAAKQAINFDFLPSNADELPFEDRIKAGLQEALYKGIDGFAGLPFILVAVGEQFKQQKNSIDKRLLLRHPTGLFRALKGLIKSKLARRPMLPRDIWSIKGIIGSGTDTAIFKDRIEQLWGCYPLETYAGTEGGVYSIQTWDYESMTFVPNLSFYELIPEDELAKWQVDRSYQPKTVLLDEVEAGHSYELVITNFHGSPLVRYRLGDVVRITSLSNEELNIDIPQMLFERRADDLIDIGFMRLTEKLIWQAIENTGIPYADWVAYKEIISDRSTLHIHLELKDNYIASEKGLAKAIYEQIKKLDDGFIHGDLPSLEKIIDFRPIEVTLLPEGSFANYISERRAEGADLAHLKPPHVNPSDKVLQLLGTRARGKPEVEVIIETQEIRAGR